MSLDRRELLERYGRLYGELGLAIAFTRSIEGEDAKRCGAGWDKTEPLATPDFAAGLIATRGVTRNPAVVLRPSGLIGLECDTREGLGQVFELGLPDTVTVRSSAPYKQHFWFHPPNGSAEFVAFRFEEAGITADRGRYLLAPPALHPSGSVYEFLRSPDDGAIAPMPESVYAELVSRAKGADHDLRERLTNDPDAKIPEGRRRETIFRYACSQRAFGVSLDVALEGARQLNRDRCQPPLSEDQISAQVEGAFKYPQATAILPSRNVGGGIYGSTKGKTLLTKALRSVSVQSPSDVSEPLCLNTVLGAFDELLLLPDHGAVLVALAGIVANYASGDVVWPLLVGPPGCGKSEIVSSVKGAPGVWPLSSLTPQTLLSGFERKGSPASLLLQIGPFGILAFKDLTTVLTMHREARSQIIGQLREVADGRTEKSFGNGLRIEWEGKLGLIAGVTPIIDEQHAFLALMGERFVLYRMPEVSRSDITRRALTRRGNEPELRERIRATVSAFLGRFREIGRLELPEGFTEPLITLADIVTRARSGVARDGYSRELLYLPEPEAPTRFAKQVAQLTASLLAIGVDEAEAWRLARKIGWDSVPAVRCQLIELLSRLFEPANYAELQHRTGLPESTVKRVVEDLVALGLAKRWKDESGKWLIEQSPLARDYWDSERGPA